MHAWFNIEFARARCEELRAEAARARLVRGHNRAAGSKARRRVARALLALGLLLVAAGNRVGDKVAVDW